MSHYRAVFISDTHLGFRGCQAKHLLDFLQSFHTDKLYLVGDIIDIWSMKHSLYWPTAHNQVLHEVFKKSRNKTEVYFIPGNHDEFFRDHEGSVIQGVTLVNEIVHTTKHGRRFLITHGDQFDVVIQKSKWLAKLGSHAYDLLLMLNGLLRRVRNLLKLRHWSLSAYLKRKVKNASNYIGNYEEAVVAEGERQGVDGVICGHIHHAEIRKVGDLAYLNCGDWVESCTAIIEQRDGEIRLIRWLE